MREGSGGIGMARNPMYVAGVGWCGLVRMARPLYASKIHLTEFTILTKIAILANSSNGR